MKEGKKSFDEIFTQSMSERSENCVPKTAEFIFRDPSEWNATKTKENSARYRALCPLRIFIHEFRL